MVINQKYCNLNIDVALEREVEGDLLLGDMGQVSGYLFKVFSLCIF